MFDNIQDILLRPGAVVVIPTDTVYGIVARATDQTAVNRLYELKHREHKPGTIIAANVDQLVELGLKRRYLTPVEQYWPGALSVVIPVGHVLDYLHLGLQSLAVRIPNDPKLRALLLTTGPLLTSSANLPGEPTAINIVEAKEYFKDHVDGYVDGGELATNVPSTVIRVVDDAIEILRPGAVKIDEAGHQG